MRIVLCISVVIFLQFQKVFCTPGFGSVFPIPLSTTNDDPNFQQCPVESGAYVHTTNCSLFHMCTFGILTTYSCIDGFFFNPTSGKCQYLPVEKEVTCTEIVKQMMNTDLFPTVESTKDLDYNHRRKSAESKCTQNGIYPDVLDCSLFHYCRSTKQHEILRCPAGLHFDPKLFMCSAPQLVDCQYEPPTEPTMTIDETESTSTIRPNTICHDYAPGSHLPVANKFDEFVICESDGKSTLMKCKPDFRYNALTTNCEMNSCAADSNLCNNHGHCVDEPTSVKGFQCICSIEYQGEYCDKPVQMINMINNKIDTSTLGRLRFTNRLSDNKKSLITAMTTKAHVDFPTKPTSPSDINNEEKISVMENFSMVNSPLSRMIRRLNNNFEHQQHLAELIQMIFIIIITLVGLILVTSTIFGVIVCIRMIISPPVETVGTWKILTEESKV